MHKMIFICNGKGREGIMMLYNTTGDFREKLLNWTNIVYRLDIDGKQYSLANSQIVEPLHATSDTYVGVGIHLPDSLYRAFSNAREVRFEMLPDPSSPV